MAGSQKASSGFSFEIKFGDIIASLNAAGNYLVGRGTQVMAGARGRGPGPMKARPVHPLHQSPWPRRREAGESMWREQVGACSGKQEVRSPESRTPEPLEV